MRYFLILSLLLFSFTNLFSQSRFPLHQISFNGFRNPSIGLEYQYNKTSVHAGYYVSNFEQDVTTKFVKVGVTEWFLPFGKKEQPSSFYSGASFIRGMTREYKNTNSIGIEAGVRWYVWKGLNFRLGAIALISKDKETKLNPTPSISYSIKF